eukprot:COSAG02_NODE_274_length_26244_cov_36.943507_26_plen_74_part_00
MDFKTLDKTQGGRAEKRFGVSQTLDKPPFVAVSAEKSGNRHKRRHRAPRWRQSALGGGANRRWAVAPIGVGRW